MNVRPPGIRSQFPKPKAYLKALGGAQPSDRQADWQRIERFAREGEFTHRYAADLPEMSYTWRSLSSDLAAVAASLRTQAIGAALGESADWMTPWRRATACEYWSDRIAHASQRCIHADHAAGRRPQYLPMVALHRSAFAIGCCLPLGWDAMAQELAELAEGTATLQGFMDGADASHRRAPWFVLRLMARSAGRDVVAAPPSARDEPLYEAALEQWSAAAEDALVPLVEAMLDRHTHEARVDANKAAYDFPWIDEWYVPYEVLALLRLRQRAGLSVGRLEGLPHPLLATPLGRLHVETPAWEDDVLASMGQRLVSLMPGA